jgi:hypothetical protein
MYGMSKQQLMAQLDVAFGGRIAEELSNILVKFVFPFLKLDS